METVKPDRLKEYLNLIAGKNGLERILEKQRSNLESMESPGAGRARGTTIGVGRHCIGEYHAHATGDHWNAVSAIEEPGLTKNRRPRTEVRKIGAGRTSWNKSVPSRIDVWI